MKYYIRCYAGNKMTYFQSCTEHSITWIDNIEDAKSFDTHKSAKNFCDKEIGFRSNICIKKQK